MRRNRRTGAALVEFAVCIPVIMILILGSMEASSTIFLKQSLHSAAYEGIRTATLRDSDEAAATSEAEQVLRVRNIRNFRIVFNPLPEDAVRGERIQIQVTASASENSPFMGRVIPDRNITVQLTMLKE